MTADAKPKGRTWVRHGPPPPATAAELADLQARLTSRTTPPGGGVQRDREAQKETPRSGVNGSGRESDILDAVSTDVSAPAEQSPTAITVRHRRERLYPPEVRLSRPCPPRKRSITPSGDRP